MGPRRHRHRRYSTEITRCFAQDSIVCAKMVTRGRIEPFCLGKMLANRNRPLALPLRGQTAKDAEEFDSPARSYENSGDPWENRTPVYGVRGRRLDRLTNGPRKKKRAGTYLFSQVVSNQVSSAQQSLTSVFGMGTGGTSASSAPAIYAQHISLTYSLYPRDAPSKLNNKLRQIRSTIKTCGQALDLLVHASSTCHHAYTLCLSTL